MCAPVSLNAAVLWSNDAGRHPEVVWQVVQSVENPECFGLAAVVKTCTWQV